uniref:SFT2 domain containing 2 n=1 Tax=Balaenoptera musculus TaxID=9771 RepID=A0A8C0D0G5_BALMU
MDKLKKVLSGQDTEDRGGLSEVVEATSLSSGTRIKGFIACFAAGILCSLLAQECTQRKHLTWECSFEFKWKLNGTSKRALSSSWDQ